MFFHSPMIRSKIFLRFGAILLSGCQNVAPSCFYSDLCRQMNVAPLSILITHDLTETEAPLSWALMVCAIRGIHASIFLLTAAYI